MDGLAKSKMPAHKESLMRIMNTCAEYCMDGLRKFVKLENVITMLQICINDTNTEVRTSALEAAASVIRELDVNNEMKAFTPFIKTFFLCLP
eukprot:UN31784